jgi:hypothetical protein
VQLTRHGRWTAAAAIGVCVAALAGAVPAAGSPAAGPDLPLAAPADAATVESGAPVALTWSAPWSCATCEIEEDLYLSTDPELADETYNVRTYCPESSAPKCPTTLTVRPLPPGTYYWAVELWKGSERHYSAISRFTVGPAAPPTALTLPRPHGGFVFTDSPTDGGGGANITAVAVSDNRASGGISMRVFARGLRRPQPGEAYFVYFDSDQNVSTGDIGNLGTDFRIRLDGDTHRLVVSRWDGAGYVLLRSSTISVRYEADDFLLTLKARDLKPHGRLTGFNFWTGTYRTTGGFMFFDWAPDYGGWNYQLTRSPGR